MTIQTIKENGTVCAVIKSGEKVITDLQSALDLLINVRYEAGTERMAIYGDFSRYTSKPLRDFIYESNRGRHCFFAASREEALRMLTTPRG